jgi:hypothetical protein
MFVIIILGRGGGVTIKMKEGYIVKICLCFTSPLLQFNADMENNLEIFSMI